MSKEAIHTLILKKSGDRLVYRNPVDEQLYKKFVEQLSDEHVVHIFFDANVDNGTLTQLAKIHACIREIARETGTTFLNAERDIKIKSGLCFDKDGEAYCRSFGDCSKDELSLAIQAIIDTGEFLGINFH